jgi:hypothetical protein
MKIHYFTIYHYDGTFNAVLRRPQHCSSGTNLYDAGNQKVIKSIINNKKRHHCNAVWE